jgi:phytoene/squalene synthetase
MDKQKQIEEMAKVIKADYKDKEWIDVTCCIPQVTSYYAECLGGAIDCAEALYNAGYRKIPELPKETVLTADDIAELLTIVARDTRKETAEKFAEMAYKRFIKLYQYNLDWKVDNDEAKAIFDEIAKEITEGK